MQTVILAGGKGTRLGHLTNNTPKPMIPINGKPFLQYQLKYIRSFGFHDVLLLVGYLSDKILEYFEDGSKFDIQLQYSLEDSLLGTGGALKNAEKMLDEEFLLLNGDTFLAIDYQELVSYFHRNDTSATITVYDNPDRIFRNNIALGESDFVVAYSKRDTEGMGYVDAGAMVLKRDVLNRIPEHEKYSLEEQIFPRLIDQKEMRAHVTNLRFYDMGTMEGIKAVESILK